MTIYKALPHVATSGLYAMSLPNHWNFAFNYYYALIGLFPVYLAGKTSSFSVLLARKNTAITLQVFLSCTFICLPKEKRLCRVAKRTIESMRAIFLFKDGRAKALFTEYFSVLVASRVAISRSNVLLWYSNVLIDIIQTVKFRYTRSFNFSEAHIVFKWICNEQSFSSHNQTALQFIPGLEGLSH